MRTLLVVWFVLLGHPALADTEAAQLAHAAQQLPDNALTPTTAQRLVEVALLVAGDDLDPAVLLAQAYIESRFDPTATSRKVRGSRRTGSWPSSQPPPFTGNLYCGIAQTQATTWAACLQLRDPAIAVSAQAFELREWLRRTRGDVALALAGYGCGNAGLKHGCRGYPGRVLAVAKRLRPRVRPLS